MYYTFCSDIIKGKNYKRLFDYLCNVADIIYFTFYEELMINKEILELDQTCEVVDVPKKIRKWFDADVIGYTVDIFIKLYLFKYNSLYELLCDRVYGAILFYSGNREIIYIQLDDFDDIYIYTNR